MTLNRETRRWLREHDPKALEQLDDALTEQDPGFPSELARAQELWAKEAQLSIIT
jgi:hypothetical protein